ncbi:DUF2946 domain-containing protein [Allohahella marinimesophila]|uniref:DUF2946 domain-containing protein n=1 Tax=Allohahella marinimesophila TaxID=1054972 RepID=UPI003CD0B97A
MAASVIVKVRSQRRAGLKARRLHQLTAWLALLSVLLIYLAPILTQTQNARRDQPASPALSHLHQSDDAQDSTEHHSHHHDFATRQSDSPASSPATDHAKHNECGYCALLTTTPPITPPDLSTHRLELASMGSGTVSWLSLPKKAPVFPDSPTRAPPVMA